jgi:hypothetical protein
MEKQMLVRRLLDAAAFAEQMGAVKTSVAVRDLLKNLGADSTINQNCPQLKGTVLSRLKYNSLEQ